MQTLIYTLEKEKHNHQANVIFNSYQKDYHLHSQIIVTPHPVLWKIELLVLTSDSLQRNSGTL